MGSRSENWFSTQSLTFGEWHSFGYACLKRKCQFTATLLTNIWNCKVKVTWTKNYATSVAKDRTAEKEAQKGHEGPEGPPFPIFFKCLKLGFGKEGLLEIVQRRVFEHIL